MNFFRVVNATVASPASPGPSMPQSPFLSLMTQGATLADGHRHASWRVTHFPLSRLQ